MEIALGIPNFYPSSGTTESSSNDAKVNRIYISKNQQPESVPLLNYIDVGSANKAILRILDLRESLFVFKEDSIWKISGENINNFRATLHDSTTALIAPDSAVQFNNTIFCMSLQGVISVSESGVAVVSRNIEQELLQLIQFDNFATTTFGVSYESERSYMLYCVNANTHSFPVQSYVYNSFTNTWVRHTFAATSGLVNPTNDKLYLGGKETGYEQYWLMQERKTFTVRDFVDIDYQIVIELIIGDSGTYKVVQVDTTDDVAIGYWLVQTDVATEEQSLGKIIDIDYDTKTAYY